ncbi:MAG: lyase family protein, partial [Clostridiales bacterium]|nr:lyase family protein [Clostridiales bacterium]
TAIGSAINVDPEYLNHVVKNLSIITGYPLKRAEDLFDATENLDGFVTVSATLKTCAVNLSKICNDLRLLSSGPRAGLGEITLPPKQNGSSIMPGKINPVIPEVVTQVAFNVIGSDVTITMAAEAGQMELNAFEPVIFYNIFNGLNAMTGAVKTLVDNCVTGIIANEDRCKQLLNSSVGISTALCPHIGYKKSAEIAKKSLKTGTPVRELVLKEDLVKEKMLDKILDPYAMTDPYKRAL